MDAPIFPLTSSVMQLNWLSRDFRNQLNKKKLHSINSSPAVLISPGLLNGSSPKHLSRAWLFVLPHLDNGDTGSVLKHSIRSVKRVWGPLLLLLWKLWGWSPDAWGLRPKGINTVWVSPAQVYGGVFHRSAPPAGSGNGTISESSVRERGHRICTSLQQGNWVLKPVFHSSKEGWGVASHFRSLSSERLMQLKFKMLTLRQIVPQSFCMFWTS